jgi:aspartate aminotransferase
MTVSKAIQASIERSSWIRKMFEEGAKLKAEKGAENVYDFSLGNPDVAPPEEFYSTFQKLASLKIDGIHGYMPNAGYPDVREKIAQRVSKEQNISLDNNAIVMTCGAAGGLNVIFKTILNPEDEIIVPTPYFVEYEFYVSNHQGKLITVKSNNDFSINIKAIESAITSKTKAILINSPNNPTGKIYSEEDITKLSQMLKTKNNGEIYLISDEPYRDIIYDGIHVPSILNHYKQSILVTSYSKTLSIPGERIGYMAVNPLCKDYQLLMSGLVLSNRILGFVNAPALMQRIVAELNDVSVNMDPYIKRRKIFMDGLTEAGYTYPKPEGAFYIFCKAPIDDDVAFVNHLKSFNILAVPGVGFSGPGYFRLSYSVSEKTIEASIPFFKKAMETI